MDIYHPYGGDLKIELVSPSSTRSVLARSRRDLARDAWLYQISGGESGVLALQSFNGFFFKFI